MLLSIFLIHFESKILYHWFVILKILLFLIKNRIFDLFIDFALNKFVTIDETGFASLHAFFKLSLDSF